MLVFVMGVFAEMSGDVSRICVIIAQDRRTKTARAVTSSLTTPRGELLRRLGARSKEKKRNKATFLKQVQTGSALKQL